MADRVLVMLAISVLLLISTASASDCPVSERCCCPRGTHLVESCTDVKNATCKACPPHTFMDIDNVLTECFDCDLTVKNGCYNECPPEGPPRLTCAPGTTDATPATTATRLSTITVPTNGSAVGSSAQPPPTNSTPSSSSPAHMTTSEHPSKSARGVSPGIIGVLIAVAVLIGLPSIVVTLSCCISKRQQRKELHALCRRSLGEYLRLCSGSSGGGGDDSVTASPRQLFLQNRLVWQLLFGQDDERLLTTWAASCSRCPVHSAAGLHVSSHQVALKRQCSCILRSGILPAPPPVGQASYIEEMSVLEAMLLAKHLDLPDETSSQPWKTIGEIFPDNLVSCDVLNTVERRGRLSPPRSTHSPTFELLLFLAAYPRRFQVAQLGRGLILRGYQEAACCLNYSDDTTPQLAAEEGGANVVDPVVPAHDDPNFPPLPSHWQPSGLTAEDFESEAARGSFFDRITVRFLSSRQRGAQTNLHRGRLGFHPSWHSGSSDHRRRPGSSSSMRALFSDSDTEGGADGDAGAWQTPTQPAPECVLGGSGSELRVESVAPRPLVSVTDQPRATAVSRQCSEPADTTLNSKPIATAGSDPFLQFDSDLDRPFQGQLEPVAASPRQKPDKERQSTAVNPSKHSVALDITPAKLSKLSGPATASKTSPAHSIRRDQKRVTTSDVPQRSPSHHDGLFPVQAMPSELTHADMEMLKAALGMQCQLEQEKQVVSVDGPLCQFPDARHAVQVKHNVQCDSREYMDDLQWSKLLTDNHSEADIAAAMLGRDGSQHIGQHPNWTQPAAGAVAAPVQPFKATAVKRTIAYREALLSRGAQEPPAKRPPSTVPLSDSEGTQEEQHRYWASDDQGIHGPSRKVASVTGSNAQWKKRSLAVTAAADDYDDAPKHGNDNPTYNSPVRRHGYPISPASTKPLSSSNPSKTTSRNREQPGEQDHKQVGMMSREFDAEGGDNRRRRQAVPWSERVKNPTQTHIQSTRAHAGKPIGHAVLSSTRPAPSRSSSEGDDRHHPQYTHQVQSHRGKLASLRNAKGESDDEEDEGGMAAPRLPLIDENGKPINSLVARGKLESQAAEEDYLRGDI
ncbi:uncharacterized protein LOC135828863 [Sycon ciliatum]|uniref:uncharacterized protein LOC135828863 n=1 Tax=Sycon ciliatum TaxID=27933 RepID=UPI0031F70B3F